MTVKPSSETPKTSSVEAIPPKKPTSKKLSYKEQRELDGMESAIQAAEEKCTGFQKQLDETNDPNRTLQLYHDLAESQKELERLYHRWQELEQK
jgi:ATP-binding cassette subfamily F protein uup